jgi:hypothetical protein
MRRRPEVFQRLDNTFPRPDQRRQVGSIPGLAVTDVIDIVPGPMDS